MPGTSPDGFRYPSLTMAPNVVADIKNLADDAQAKVVLMDAVSTALGGRLLNIGKATVATSESTTSGVYADLATAGPAVTLTTRTLAVVIWSAKMFTNSASDTAFTAVAVSGATTIGLPDNSRSLFRTIGDAGLGDRLFAVDVLDLTAGSNTFTLKYAFSGASSATFGDRRLIVWAP